jgi:hypothetical protein
MGQWLNLTLPRSWLTLPLNAGQIIMETSFLPR